MKNGRRLIPLWLPMLLFVCCATATSYTRPGKPTITRCRSPEMETFTCWWEPGPDGGLPTTYALYYYRENSEKEHECSDYITGGKNSCFFDKNDTFIWVTYNITVVATNALGRTLSDHVDVDVVYIVEPNPPVNLKVAIQHDKGWPFLRASWDPPQNADTSSGWVMLIYELRIKLQEEDKWEVHHAGQQRTFNIYSLQSEGTYIVQIRCRPDHGSWSEWSEEFQISIPNYFPRARSAWTLIMVFSALLFLIIAWLLHTNSHSLKHCLLPPVPVPKIKGFDKSLFKSGKSADAFRSLDVLEFPHHPLSKSEDLLVEYIEVYVPEERELMLEKCTDLHSDRLKSVNSVSDCDSGRGSCDSHNLLLEKSRERADHQVSQVAEEAERASKALEEERLAYIHEDVVSPDMSTGKVKTWPSVFSSMPQNRSSSTDQTNSLDMSKQHCLSDNVFHSGLLPSYHTPTDHNTKEYFGSNYWDFSFATGQVNQAKSHYHIQARSEANISRIGTNSEPVAFRLPTPRSNEYVEVQRVNEEDNVVLHPVSTGHGKYAGETHQEDNYSRVRVGDNDNMLLLLPENGGTQEEMDACSCEPVGVEKSSYTSFTTDSEKPTTYTTIAPQAMEERAINGYVDTATMFNLPTY